MPIPVTCQCGQSFRAKDDLAGKKVKCPKCAQPLQIPSPTGGATAELSLDDLMRMDAAAPTGGMPAMPMQQSMPMQSAPGIPAGGGFQTPNAFFAQPGAKPRSSAGGNQGFKVAMFALGGVSALAVIAIVLIFVFRGDGGNSNVANNSTNPSNAGTTTPGTSTPGPSTSGTTTGGTSTTPGGTQGGPTGPGTNPASKKAPADFQPSRPGHDTPEAALDAFFSAVDKGDVEAVRGTLRDAAGKDFEAFEELIAGVVDQQPLLKEDQLWSLFVQGMKQQQAAIISRSPAQIDGNWATIKVRVRAPANKQSGGGIGSLPGGLTPPGTGAIPGGAVPPAGALPGAGVPGGNRQVPGGAPGGALPGGTLPGAPTGIPGAPGGVPGQSGAFPGGTGALPGQPNGPGIPNQGGGGQQELEDTIDFVRDTQGKWHLYFPDTERKKLRDVVQKVLPKGQGGSTASSGPKSPLKEGLAKWYGQSGDLRGQKFWEEGAYQQVPFSYSWMVDLLPYMGHDDIHAKFNFKKGFGDGANRPLANTVIRQFLNPADNRTRVADLFRYETGLAVTHFVGMAGIEDERQVVAAQLPRSDPRAGVFGYDRIAKPSEITDGTSNTIMMIGADMPRPWAQGGGATIRGAREPYFGGITGSMFGSRGVNGAMVLMADGSARVIPANINPAVFRAMCTIHGAETVDLKPYPEAPDLFGAPKKRGR